MRWLHTEYLLKGIFLGLIVFASLQLPELPSLPEKGAETSPEQYAEIIKPILTPWREAAWAKTGYLTAFMTAGFLFVLVLSFLSWVPRGIRIGGKFLSLILFLILESPTLIYVGLVGGLLSGALYIKEPRLSDSLLPICIGGGALVGLAIGEARRIGSSNWRSSAAAAVACILVGAAIYYIEKDPVYRMDVDSPMRFQFGLHLLLGLPFFYLLTFAGRAEESEAEIAALAGGMAVAVWLINVTPSLPSLALIIPAMLYVVYTRYVMPGLRVFKHALRGYSYFQMGKIRPALLSFRRALTLDPKNELALAGVTHVHSGIDLKQIANDPETVALLDLNLCLNRAGRLLWRSTPTSEQLTEVDHLLELVSTQQPQRKPEVEYWRAVADMRTRKVESAASRLSRFLDPDGWQPTDQPSRQAMLFPAWQLALVNSPELAARVGKPQIGLPGRRMEAIAACERLLADNPKNEEAWELKRQLYDGLTEKDFHSRMPSPGEFDAAYVRELALALLNDAARWRRGVEYLRMAAAASPQNAPSILIQAAQAYERAGEVGSARETYHVLKDAGLAFGHKNLPDSEKAVFYPIVKRLADEAATANKFDDAIALLRVITDGDRAGIETYRSLAEMHERLGDAFSALHFNDLAMVYNSSDPDLVARKDKYYYSVKLDQVRQLPDATRARLDVDYCLKKARTVLASKGADLDSVDWALHLAEFAVILKPDWLEPKFLIARAQLWKGERDLALKLLEDIREAKPAKFLGGGDEDAWYRCNQLLGDLYLNDYARPDLAIPCYLEFRQSAKSGADTLFKLGQAYEAAGDRARAINYYEQVTGYTEHPRYFDAQEAVRRLKG